MSERELLEHRLRAFYRVAGLAWSGCVNDQVSDVFYRMLREAAACSHVMDFVPRPPGGRASMVWLATQLAKMGQNQLDDRLYFTCVRKAALSYKTEMMMACIL